MVILPLQDHGDTVVSSAVVVELQELLLTAGAAGALGWAGGLRGLQGLQDGRLQKNGSDQQTRHYHQNLFTHFLLFELWLFIKFVPRCDNSYNYSYLS